MSDPKKYQIEVHDHDGVSHRVDLTSDEMFIGRSKYAEIQLKWGTISRKHAKITPKGDGTWHISDQGSRDGILINGKRSDDALIKLGDVISISHFRLKLVEKSSG
jgi:pSer/pThr/pTyr-binding forkhead associated (FHA) protein